MILEATEYRIIIWILIGNTIIAFFNLLIKVIRKDLKKGLITSTFIFLCPLVGVLYLALSYGVYELYFKRKESVVSREELSLSKERVGVMERPDLQGAYNKVPFEEAFIISDNNSVRRLLLNELKSDRNNSLKSILKAVEHEDSEVSHYAASAISEIIDEFRENEKELRVAYYDNKDNTDLCKRYLSYLHEFLSQNILSIEEQRRYVLLYEDVLKTVENYSKSAISGELYNQMVGLLLDIEAYESAKVWKDKALEYKADEVESFKAGLRYYFKINDHVSFLELLDRLKGSNLRLDNELVEMVRFFNS